MNDKTSSTVIVGTAENAAEMAAAVKRWPELHGLVKSLQQQNLFPGLRAMRIRLTGGEQFVAKGLDAINFKNTSNAE